MQRHVNLVDFVKSFPTSIFLQNLASIQKRKSPIKFAHLAEKSEKGSISNLSTKALAAPLVPRVWARPCGLSTRVRDVEALCEANLVVPRNGNSFCCMGAKRHLASHPTPSSFR